MRRRILINRPNRPLNWLNLMVGTKCKHLGNCVCVMCQFKLVHLSMGPLWLSDGWFFGLWALQLADVQVLVSPRCCKVALRCSMCACGKTRNLRKCKQRELKLWGMFETDRSCLKANVFETFPNGRSEGRGKERRSFKYHTIRYTIIP